MKKPETIEQRWDILYREYPEVYDEFANVPYSKNDIDIIEKLFKLKGKIVADIGAGSGVSTFQLAKYARQVVGIEPERSLIDIAEKVLKEKEFHNVFFKEGWAHTIPLQDNSVDITISITGAFFHDANYIRKFVEEATRITKSGGFIITLGTAPFWYGGELASVILGKTRKTDLDPEGVADDVLTNLGFSNKDFYSVADYGTVDRAIKTYGFIFGRKAIDYLKQHQKTTIKWKYRIHYQQVKKQIS